MPDIDVRLLTDKADLAQAARTFRTAMVGLPPLGPIDDALLEGLFEPDRTYGAFEDGALVGTTDSYSGRIAVPGGAWVPQAAVTHVGVLPTHTRRGIATALFNAQLAAAREQGEAVATLRASDARIYGNFGYAIANTSVSFEVDAERARLRKSIASSDRVRLIDIDSSWPAQARIYASQPAPRAGVIFRSRYWWDMQKTRQDKSGVPAYVAVVGPEGAETGFVRYHPSSSEHWFLSSERTVVVDDIVAHDPAAYVALVAHLLAIDLPHRILFASRPADDLLPWLFEDFRSVRVTAIRDETWLRLLDVEKALSSRSYAGRDSVVLEVADPILPANTTRLRISRDGAERTNLSAAVTADIATVSAAYLGGVKWWQLAHSGRLGTFEREEVEMLDALFAVPTNPYSGTIF
ncbi:GNAT family N-acetyltransferase [Mesorhizobium sp. BAC0120]|uniref:GNAT family N-acetyltransferase n=1 Tax=Mesorhizobium sp. BAC0120 TaxID=3090670 RepID=UPI00298C0208|nr:GNAT family N-acetyltransferase [Mesorhizobium sp. BAC0120]MDW6020618.1 GNAT family N-acetyltransferase [Mesorhizobium sp. BAC0120]